MTSTSEPPLRPFNEISSLEASDLGLEDSIFNIAARLKHPDAMAVEPAFRCKTPHSPNIWEGFNPHKKRCMSGPYTNYDTACPSRAPRALRQWAPQDIESAAMREDREVRWSSSQFCWAPAVRRTSSTSRTTQSLRKALAQHGVLPGTYARICTSCHKRWPSMQCLH